VIVRTTVLLTVFASGVEPNFYIVVIINVRPEPLNKLLKIRYNERTILGKMLRGISQIYEARLFVHLSFKRTPQRPLPSHKPPAISTPTTWERPILSELPFGMRCPVKRLRV
jgi:hypothetical protein